MKFPKRLQEKKEITTNTMRRILILLPNNLGDVIMTLPVLDGLKKKYPQSHCTFFVEDGFEAGLVNFTSCDFIYKFPRKMLRDLAKGEMWKNGLSQLKHIVKDLKKHKFDSVINLSQHPYLAFITALLNVTDTKGGIMLKEGNLALNDSWSQYLYCIPFGRIYNRLHATDIYKKIAGLDYRSNSFITLSKDEEENARSFLKSKGISEGTQLVVFQPGASYSAKRWPVDNFISLGKMLINDGYHLLITGAPSEKDIGTGIFNQLSSNCTLLSGETTFRETIAITSLCKFCITGDTALMHAAAALHKQVFAIFGSTNPVETGPYGNGHIIFTGRCTNRPCFCTECKSKLCMKSISPYDIYKAIQGELSENTHYNCDVFTTNISEDGLYNIQQSGKTKLHYYNETASLAALRAFDSTVILSETSEDYEAVKEQSRKFISIVKLMEDELTQYLHENNNGAISKFENYKNELIKIKGIADFWSALLNIRLNSIPLIDFTKGISQSRNACTETYNQISRVFNI